jgi:Cu-Zn family superoxide dismutase
MARSTKRRVIVVASLVGALALALLGLTSIAQADAAPGRALLRDSGGRPAGVVKLTQEQGKVLVRAVVHDLTLGFHGFHVHAVGECVPPFTSAGGHYNPEGESHGDHAGDMPVLLVNEDGSGQLRFTTDRFALAELSDSDGSAIIVHALADNYANVPDRYHSHTEDTFGPDSVTLAVGDAGGRLACGVVQ